MYVHKYGGKGHTCASWAKDFMWAVLNLLKKRKQIHKIPNTVSNQNIKCNTESKQLKRFKWLIQLK